MSYDGHFQINSILKKIVKHIRLIDSILSVMLFEKLLEQRDSFLNTLKHLNFQLMMDPSKKEIDDIEIMQKDVIQQLKKIEQKLAYIYRVNHIRLQ